MKNKFLTGRLNGAKYALKGAVKLLKTEHSVQVQAAIAVLMTILGFVFEISKTEWMFQIFAVGLVMSIEGVNSAIEEIADFIHPTYHKKIGLVKDIAAGPYFLQQLLLS